MRYAVISDIHSNLEALRTVLAEIESKKVDEIVCLGDVVGYGANPDEVAEIVRSVSTITIMGNHDDAVHSGETYAQINSFAKAAIKYTRELLSDANSEWLKNLPFDHKLKDVFLVHSSPSEPREWKYIFSEADARIELSSFQEKICMIGHTHIPVVFRKITKGGTGETLGQMKELINVGSVGQPRDGDNRASFGIIDTGNFIYEHFRLEYDVRMAAEKIVAAGLPTFLAERLHRGR
ncbi:MAG TPA: metallophosphoesterase family protein [Candidatus Kryptonia bacterium]